jgi:hypothetical protein
LEGILKSRWLATFAIFSMVSLFVSCSLVKTTGTLTRKGGEALTDLSEENEGSFVGKVSGFAGNLYTSIGSTVEDAADGEKGAVETGTDVTKSAIGVVQEEAGSGASGTSASSRGKLAKEDIVRLQTRLKDEGYDPGKVDGIWGGNTVKALKNYQRDQGLSVTGNADAETLASLDMM